MSEIDPGSGDHLTRYIGHDSLNNLHGIVGRTRVHNDIIIQVRFDRMQGPFNDMGLVLDNHAQTHHHSHITVVFAFASDDGVDDWFTGMYRRKPRAQNQTQTDTKTGKTRKGHFVCIFENRHWMKRIESCL